ncbi:hypothetical protein Q3G72_020675 [Acer saccharum]|nr:hypothetical protein Q3G72_020675 [Acer saccharum]
MPTFLFSLSTNPKVFLIHHISIFGQLRVHKGRQAVASSPLSRGPMIDPDAVELQAVMKLSRKEHEEMMRAELDPRGKRTSTEAEKESFDKD